MNILQIIVISAASAGWGLFSLWYWTRGSRRMAEEEKEQDTTRSWLESFEMLYGAIVDQSDEIERTQRELLSLVRAVSDAPEPPEPPSRPGYTVVKK